ncbi:MAG: class I SAM-dependent methyltransferase [Nanoarchaeota archaeon]|nr:class I SAM-dependent methyltransferase [Nanoarchaeota archaeon]
MRVLDLGCGNNKLKGAFGVDFVNLKGVDFVWNLNNQLPKEYHNKFDVVYSKCVIDHIGNPLNFLEGCKNYLKKKGKLILIVDNGDYWRYHLHFGNYHADIWEENDPNHPETHHKMSFQMKHLTKLLKLLNFKIIKTKYFHDYDNRPLFSKLVVGHLDLFLPKHLGTNLMRIEAINF